MKLLRILFIALFFIGCVNLDVVKIDKYSNVVAAGNKSIAIQDNRAHSKTATGKSRISATSKGLGGGLYDFELDRPLEGYFFSAITKKCQFYKCKKLDSQEVKISIYIDDLEMIILPGPYTHELLGAMSTTIEIIDFKGKPQKMTLKVEVEKEVRSNASRVPTMMGVLIGSLLGDYSEKFVRGYLML